MSISESEFKAYPKMPRLLNERIIITEKIDGTNAQILVFDPDPPDELSTERCSGKKDFKIGSRNRWISPGKENDNYGFAAWCYEHKEELLNLHYGRHFGEWWGNGIQRGYDVPDKRLSLFDTRLADLVKFNIPCATVVPVLYNGANSDLNVMALMDRLKHEGSRAAPGFMNPEGIIIQTLLNPGMYKFPFDPEHKGAQA